jgi:hypothetical protein
VVKPYVWSLPNTITSLLPAAPYQSDRLAERTGGHFHSVESLIADGEFLGVSNTSPTPVGRGQ